MKLTPSEQIMYNVLHITMLDDSHKPKGFATGFLFGFCSSEKGSAISLVTNRHVLSNCSNIRISFTSGKEDGSPDVGNIINVETETKYAIYHPDDSIDLAVLPIANVIDSIYASGKKAFYAMFTVESIPTADEWNQYSAIEDVVMAGFPKGLRDEVNNQPIIRSGVTATHPALNFQGRPEFLVDMPCFEGCSGSPVLICNEGWVVNKRIHSISTGSIVKLLGIQYAIPSKYIIGQLATVPTAGTKDIPIVQLYLNLGFIIKSSELLVF